MEVKPRPAMFRDYLCLRLVIIIHVGVEEMDHLVAMIGQGAKAD